MPTPARSDVLIIGGGPAGLAAAIGLRLAAPELDVLVAEAGDEPGERFGETLPPDILVLLDGLGVLEAFRADGHLPCPGSVSAWGSANPGHNDFILNVMGPAWHIHRERLERMLRARAAQAGARLYSRTRAVAVAQAGDGFDVLLRLGADGERWVHADRVIDASGPRAWFARRQGASRLKQDRMVAIVRFADLRSGTFTSQSVVEAAPEGWWYCARVPDDRIVTVLVTEPRDARALASGDYAQWRRRLAVTSLLAPRLAACELEGERLRSYAAGSSTLDRVEGDRWLAVGDAACTLDPICSQGIHKALSDAADAARTIAAAAGHRPPLPWRYAERVAARFQGYLANRAHLYELERRWSAAPFWRDRTRA